jgi:hypothetical protein
MARRFGCTRFMSFHWPRWRFTAKESAGLREGNLNDSKGHEAGDQVLCLLGAILLRHTRFSDCSARLGGDAFAIMMPNTDREDCATLGCHRH